LNWIKTVDIPTIDADNMHLTQHVKTCLSRSFLSRIRLKTGTISRILGPVVQKLAHDIEWAKYARSREFEMHTR
jgi:hypothetical protein